MATGKPKFYWDAAPLIAWIRDEKRADPAEMDGLAEVVEMVESNKAILMTSVLWRTEVLGAELTAPQRHKLKQAFEQRFIEELGIDSRVMDLAGEIRAFHKAEKSADKMKNVRTPDAIHLASAIHYEATEFHTFDGKKADGGHARLLTLNGNVAGRKLKICAPKGDQLRLQFPTNNDDAAVESGDEND